MTEDRFELLERFVGCSSTSGEEGPYTRMVAEHLRGEGYAVELQEVAPERHNLIARPEGAAPVCYFSTHLDVVPPHIPPRRDGDALYGRGTADTKGPLVAMLAAARVLRAEGIPAGFLLVVGEEVDHCGARVAAEGLDLDGARIILGEPTSNRVVAAQKGMLKVWVRAEGVAGHSAFPDRGVSAIHRLIDLLAALRDAPWPSDPALGQTTWNCGLISGGVAGNVFAPAAEAQLVIRVAAPLAEVRSLVEARVAAGDGLSLELISQNEGVIFESPPGFETCVIPFNSDAAYLAPLGPVWLGGPGAIELAHSDDEHITRLQLERGVELYTRLGRAAAGRS